MIIKATIEIIPRLSNSSTKKIIVGIRDDPPPCQPEASAGGVPRGAEPPQGKLQPGQPQGQHFQTGRPACTGRSECPCRSQRRYPGRR